MGQSIRNDYEASAQNSPALGVVQVYDIPRTGDLESLMIALSGSVTLSGAGSALTADGILNLISDVELVADNGKVVIASVPFRMLANGNLPRRKHGAVPSITQPGVTAAAHAFEAEAILDMGYGLMRAKDTFLRENAYTDLKLRLRFASSYAVVSDGTVGALTIATAVRARETLELPDADGVASSPSVRLQRTANDLDVAGAVTRKQFKLTAEQGLRGIVLRVVNGSAALSDAVLSRVRVTVGKMERMSLSATVLKEPTKTEFVGTQLTGYYFIDFADGNGAPDKLTDTLDLTSVNTGGADSFIEIDTAAAGTITIDQIGYVAL
jgi:hypothetical protein